MTLTYELQRMVADEISHVAAVAAQAWGQAGYEAEMAALQHKRPFMVLRPRVFHDGNQWCALYGENLQDGVAGFGDTPAKAAVSFDLVWLNEKAGIGLPPPANRSGVATVPASGPLRELGAYLASLLDEDQWAKAEALLLKAGASGVQPAEPLSSELATAARRFLTRWQEMSECIDIETVMSDSELHRAADALEAALGVKGPDHG